LCLLLLNPLLKNSADLFAKQIAFEKKRSLISEGERGLELIGRAIRMAGYRNIQSNLSRNPKKPFLQVQQNSGYQNSDAFSMQYQLPNGIHFDCIGNVLNEERTRNGLAYQGFVVERQAGVAKGVKVNGGSLICQSLDRQGRLQNTTLMNGVNKLLIEEITHPSHPSAQRLFKVGLHMTDGISLNVHLERTFSTRNLP
jgi:hypothetical protein